MTVHLGFYNTSTTRTHVGFQFSTHASAGGNVAPSSAIDAADIRIYRAADGGAFSATQRSSASGITVTSPFDSLTGFHNVDIDLTDNTDAGFYTAGYRYSVVLAPDDETIDSLVITGVVLAVFEIGVAKADLTNWLGTAPLALSSQQVQAVVPVSTVVASVSGAVGSVTGAVGSVTGNVGGNVNGNVTGSTGSVTGNVGGNVTGSVGSVAGNVSGSVGSVAGAVGSVTGSVGSVVGNVGGNVVGSTASVAGAVGSVTGNVGGDVAGKVLGGGAGTISGDGVRAASVTGAVGSVTGAVGSVTGAVGSVTAAVTVGTNNDKAGYSISGTITTLDPLPAAVRDVSNLTPAADSLGAAVNSATAPSAATVADAVWDEVLSGHQTAGTAGEALSSAGSGGISAGVITNIANQVAAILGDNPVYFQSPVTTDGTLDLVQGMDYYTADGRDIEFSFVRDYVPTSCKLTIAAGSVVTVTSTDITESSGSGSGRFSVRFQLPRATGDDLEAGPGTFEVLSILSSREIPEISEGVATIRRRLTA